MAKRSAATASNWSGVRARVFVSLVAMAACAVAMIVRIRWVGARERFMHMEGIPQPNPGPSSAVITAFHQAETKRKVEKDYSQEEVDAFEVLTRVLTSHPTGAAVKHYAAASKRDGLDKRALEKLVRRDLLSPP